MLHTLYNKKTSVVEGGVRRGFHQAFRLHSNNSLEGRPVGYHVLQGRQYSMMRPVYRLLTYACCWTSAAGALLMAVVDMVVWL